MRDKTFNDFSLNARQHLERVGISQSRIRRMALTLQTIGQEFPSIVYLEGKTMVDLVREAHKEVGAQWQMLDIQCVPVTKLTPICQLNDKQFRCA